jgi:exo-beta-1,3-glucanase (GH17 family)
MFNPRLRHAALALLAGAAFGVSTAAVMPASASAATHANPTGSPSQDNYCEGAAELLDDLEQIVHTSTDPKVWGPAANEFLDVLYTAQDHGCTFYQARLRERAIKAEIRRHQLAAHNATAARA